MTAENFQRAFEELQSRTPFRPFTVEMVGGRRVEVDHLRALVYRDGVGVYVQPGGIPVLFDHESVVAVVADIAGASAG